MSNTPKSGMPSGIPYIIGNELAERFSFYGMKAILTVFMTDYLLGRDGQLDLMSENDSKFWYHTFVMATYFFPLLGALVSDIAWGKYRTIIILSILYCFGHIALAMDETRLGLSLGLTMIAIGSGGIKPCVSAHVGDQFTNKNKHLLERVFSYFYLSINMGAAISSILTPILLQNYGPWLAFGVPGSLMIIATIIFWLGRNAYTSIPGAGILRYRMDLFERKGYLVILKLSVIYLFIAVFWSLFDQTGSSWVLQAKSVYVNKNIDLRFGIFDTEWLNFNILPSQVQAANPIMILLLVPLFTFFIYPKLGRLFKLTPLRKISIGMFIAALSFAIIAWMEMRITSQATVSIGWQFLAYFVLTVAEVMVSITALEFSYTQAPNSMKSLIMGCYLLSVSFGNFIAAFVNGIIQRPDGTSRLEGADYFWFFTILMLVTAIGFIFVAMNYKEKTFIQGGGDDDHDEADPIIWEKS